MFRSICGLTTDVLAARMSLLMRFAAKGEVAVSDCRSGATRRITRMSEHRFAVGQPVHLKSRTGYLPKDAETYLVTALLPERDNSPQYRVRAHAEQHERVTTEDNLKPAASPIDVASALFG
jgi:hypothetical protein